MIRTSSYFIVAAVMFSGCAPIGGSGQNSTPVPTPEPAVSGLAKLAKESVAREGAVRAAAWKRAAEEADTVSDWTTARALVRKRMVELRAEASSEFTAELDRLTDGVTFTPEKFRELCRKAAGAFE